MTTREMSPKQAMFANGQRNEFFGSYYDTYRLTQAEAAPNKIYLFSDPKSSTKGIELTNMTDSKKLNAGEEIDVDKVRVQFINTFYLDIANFLKSYCLIIKYGGKLIFEEPLDACPGGGGINLQAAVTTTATTTTINYAAANNGPLHPDAGFRLVEPNLLYLASGPAIEVYMECGGTAPTATATASGGSNVFMRVYLDGLRRTLL